MTNQQGAPGALPDPSPDQLRAIARTARNSSGSASDDCGPLAYVLHGWRAAAIAFRAQQAALVEAQQPAPSAAAEHAETMRRIGEGQAFEAWFKVDCPVEGVNARIAAKAAWQARAALDAPHPSPTPQADSQPAPVLDSLALMKVVMRADEALAGRCTRGTTNWAAAIGKAVQDAVLAARAPADSVTAPAGGAVAEVMMAIRPPKASPAWLPHKIIHASLQWLDSVPVGTKLYATPPAQAADSVLEDAAWMPLTPELLPAIESGDYGARFWLAAHNNSEPQIGVYEWRQGRNPHGFNSDLGRYGASEITHVMPYKPPTLPAARKEAPPTA